MAIKHVVTQGFGFADGTKFIPTRGHTPSAAQIFELSGILLGAPSVVGSITVSGIWTVQSASGSTWTIQTADGSTWTVQTPNSGTWTVQ